VGIIHLSVLQIGAGRA